MFSGRVQSSALKRKPLKRTKYLIKRKRGAKGKKQSGEAKPKSVSKLMKELDRVVSLLVRLSAADHEGIVTCYTCGHRFHYKKIQCGHYVSRFYKAVRWNADNLRPQCMMCNMWKRGDLITFREKLIKEIGEPAVLYLEQSRRISQKLDAQKLTTQIQDVTTRLSPLLKEFSSQPTQTLV